MPIYRYKCKSCDIEFEDLVRLNDPPPACSECGSESKKILHNSFSFFVKGSPHRSFDSVIGEDAEKKWSRIEQRRNERKAVNQKVKKESV